MSRIILFLPGNIFHSNVLQKRLKNELLPYNAGMDTLRQSNIPILFAWQAIDEILAPHIYHPGRHQLCAGSFSHVLHNFLSEADSLWQSKNGVANTPARPDKCLDVTFFPEFAPPAQPDLILSEFFLLLAGQTRYYQAHNPLTQAVSPPQNAPAIKWGNKTGLLINSGSKIREAWHLFQRRPKEHLMTLIEATQTVARQEQPFHIALWDLETPFVGSIYDANALWEMYFSALDRYNLTGYFTDLESCLPWYRENAVPAPPPHRLMHKWTVHSAQLQYLERAYRQPNSAQLNRLQRRLLALAQTSDVLSALHSFIEGQISLSRQPPLKYRAEVIQLGYACLELAAQLNPSLNILAELDPVLGPRLVKFLQTA